MVIVLKICYFVLNIHRLTNYPYIQVANVLDIFSQHTTYIWNRVILNSTPIIQFIQELVMVGVPSSKMIISLGGGGSWTERTEMD